MPASDTLPGLRILKHCIISVYVMLKIEVIGIRCSPMKIECISDLVLSPCCGSRSWSL